MEAKRLLREGFPPEVIDDAYNYFRYHPHHKPKEVRKYVEERYKEQNRADDNKGGR